MHEKKRTWKQVISNIILHNFFCLNTNEKINNAEWYEILKMMKLNIFPPIFIQNVNIFEHRKCIKTIFLSLNEI